METMERKKPRPRRSFTPEFKAEIVELCRRGDRSIGQVARDFDLTETNVRTWVKQAEIDQGERPGLTTEEKEELTRLRRENRPLEIDDEIAQACNSFLRSGDPMKVDPFIEAEKSQVTACRTPVACSRSPSPPTTSAATASPRPATVTDAELTREDHRHPHRVQGHLWRPADPQGALASPRGVRASAR